MVDSALATPVLSTSCGEYMDMHCCSTTLNPDKLGGLVSMDIALASVCNVGELHTGAHQEGILTTCQYSSTSKEFLNLILSPY